MTEQEYSIDKLISDLSELQTQLNIIPLSKKATVNNNEQPSKRRSEEKRHTKRSEEKRPSWWVRVREKLKKVCKAKNEATNHASDSDDSQGESRKIRRYSDEDQEDLDLDIRKLQSDVGQMISALKNLTEFQTNVSKSLERVHSINVGAILHKTDSIKSRAQDLQKIRRKISALKCYIPSSLYKQSSRVLSITDSLTAEEVEEIDETGIDICLRLHVSEYFKSTLAFEEVVDKFQSLDFPQKLCLLSFAVFPEIREVERTMLMYWWIGEGFINCDESEKSVTKILDEFSTKRLLERVEDERKLKPSSYRMEPHVHSAVIYLAKYVNLFELYGFMEKSSKGKVYLVKGSSLLPMAKSSAMKPKTLQTIFNSSERFPDFTFDWFPLMNSLGVLYLGRWERTPERQIEVDSTKFLKNIKYPKNLRLASFQGIERMERLERSICTLEKLVILDLRECYDLQFLPDDIGLLENLVYLDASGCPKLDYMPNGIAKLSRLQVLKGFVISQSDDKGICAVQHLVNLRKLSITVKNYRFKVENLMESLKGLNRLESLKIAWRLPTNSKKENQKGLTTEKKHKDQMEPEDDLVQKQGQTSEEKKRDVKETSNREDGRNDTANLEEGKKQEEVKAESLKSEKVLEGEKTSPSQEVTETIQNKPGDRKGKNKAEEEGDANKSEADLEEGKKRGEVEAEKSKSDKVTEGDAKTSTPQESKDTIRTKPNDHREISKVQEKGDGEKKGDDLKKLDGGEAKTHKSDQTIKFGKKVSFSENSKAMIQKKPDDLKRDNAMAEEINETPSSSKISRSSKAKMFHSSLKKLKLEAYPDKNPPSWLNPEHLDNLEKLCIQGGELNRISDEPSTAEYNNWPVKILRLKHLYKFVVEWRDLQALFPQMILLEKFKCPKVTFCPTDSNGVWKGSQPQIMMESKGYSLARAYTEPNRKKARKVLCMCI